MFAEAIEEDFSYAIGIFTSLALALQKMQIPEMYKFWKSCSEANVNNDTKTEIKRRLGIKNDYKDFGSPLFDVGKIFFISNNNDN